MSWLTCDVCARYVDTDYNPECFMDDGSIRCEHCRCLTCGEKRPERGFEQCRSCLVDHIASNPEEIETIFEPKRFEVAEWVKAAYPDKTVAPVVMRLAIKQAG